MPDIIIIASGFRHGVSWSSGLIIPSRGTQRGASGSCSQACTTLTLMCISSSMSKQKMKKPGSSTRPRPTPPQPLPPPPPRDGYRRPQRRDESVKPPVIDDYVEPCQDFYGGRRGADPGRGQAVCRYLEDWERMWEHISPAGANVHGIGRFLLWSSCKRWDLTDGGGR